MATWKEVKDHLESLGVTDTTEVEINSTDIMGCDFEVDKTDNTLNIDW